MAKFQTKYGCFSDSGDEYIINTYKTPKPWVNIISNGNYGLVISQAGGGFSWLEHSEFNRLNRWHQDLVQDNWGKYFYIKNNDTDEIWSPTWMPVKTDLDFYQVTYGFGYAIFESQFKKIRICLTVFVPLNEQVEIWNFRIENKNSSQVNIAIYSYFEWCLGSSADHHREFHKTFLETEFDPELNSLIATKRLWEIPLSKRGHWNIKYPYFGFISCSLPVIDYEGDKESFIGNYGSVNKPAGLFTNHMGKKTGKWSDSIGTIKTELILEGSSYKELNFILGIKHGKKEISKSVLKFKDTEIVNQALSEVKKFWVDLLNKTTVMTPDDGIDILVNKWLRYQAVSGRLWARTAYYQQSGAYGFRDQLQDSLVFLPLNPSFTLNQIQLHARHQFKDGSVLHWWHPITETGLQTKMTDDLLWLPFVLIQYINETGDYKALNLKEPYYENTAKKDSLFNHCVAAIERVLKRFSKRGLPLIGAGDWNDGLSAVGLNMKGESIWLAEFLYMILNDFAIICKKTKNEKLFKRYSRKAEKLKQAFDKYAWDGEWYFRATKDDGKKIGSRTNNEGKIYLNAQTWAVISGIADSKRSEKALDSVTKYLFKKNGPLLLYPAYSNPDEMIGYLSRYAPGKRENGGVYTHAATWLIWASAMLKRNELAYEAYKRLSPVLNGLNPDEYSAEPFVTPGNIDGPDSSNYGLAGWTWYTGSASWFQKVIVDWILGIRASDEGLIIDPCIPKEWKQFSVKRFFRKSVYNITVNNTNGLPNQLKCIEVDGNKISGNVIKIMNKKEVDVKVYID